MVSGNVDWVLAVNIVIWTGLFLYLLRLERRLNAHRSDVDRGQREESQQ